MTNGHTPESGGDRNVGDKVKQDAAAAKHDVKHLGKDMADSVAAEATSYAERAKAGAADEVKGVASALRTAADELRSGSPQERTFSQIADGLADASEAIRDKDLGEIVGAMNGFARRNPLTFLGGAALLGFAATRFAKASSHRETAQTTTPGAYQPASTSPGAQAGHMTGSTPTSPGSRPGMPSTPGGQR